MLEVQNPILNRMLEATGAYNLSRLAMQLGVRPQTVQPYKTKDYVPDSWYEILQTTRGLNPGYLKTGKGPVRITGGGQIDIETSRLPFETMIFHPNGKERVLSQHPAAGLVTNASGLELPINHMVEHLLCPEVRPILAPDGTMTLTGGGIALPLIHLQSWGASPENVRSLATVDGLIVFDQAQAMAQVGAPYVIASHGYLALMRFELGNVGATFVPFARGTATPDIPVSQGADGVTPRIMGRAIWIGSKL